MSMTQNSYAPPALLAAALAALVLMGCANRASAPVSDRAAGAGEDGGGMIADTGRGASEAASAARQTTMAGIPDAAAAPLEDLNIRRDEIPESLASIDYVYAAYPPPDCVAIAAELSRLDVDLGRDYDDDAEDEASLGQRGGEAAGDLVIDTIRGVTTDVIPFRSVVRQASGAAAFERRRARAFTAGHARRAYLKGLAVGQGCAPPAAPLVLRAPEEEPAVELRDTRDAPVNEDWGAPTP